jgi:hypothetical protein
MWKVRSHVVRAEQKHSDEAVGTGGDQNMRPSTHQTGCYDFGLMEGHAHHLHLLKWSDACECGYETNTSRLPLSFMCKLQSGGGNSRSGVAFVDLGFFISSYYTDRARAKWAFFSGNDCVWGNSYDDSDYWQNWRE